MHHHPEYQYLALLRDCLVYGVHREGRNGGTYGLFGRQIRFDLTEGFPLLTTKKMFFKGIVVELLWFLRGDTNEFFLEGIRQRLGITREETLEANIDKLGLRYQGLKYSDQAAQDRADKVPA